jgi:hypothetical protein
VNQLSLFLRAWVTAAVLLAAISCSHSPTARSPLDQRFTLAPGEMAQLAEASIGVRFDGVTTRAARPVRCLPGGDALVHVTVMAGSSVRP